MCSHLYRQIFCETYVLEFLRKVTVSTLTVRGKVVILFFGMSVFRAEEVVGYLWHDKEFIYLSSRGGKKSGY